jgi:serine/threonine protein kinase
MSQDFQREYLLRLSLPLAQLYSRAHNAKDARGRHDNTFYLFEALVKLAAAPAVACYLREVELGSPRVEALDRLLAHLALPSLGQWAALLRDLSQHFSRRADAASHPLGHVHRQLTTPRRDLPALLALYRRIKNGPDGAPAGAQACSVLQVFDALVQYRNGVFGHGAGRFESFYDQEMGPLLFPAANELLAEGTLDLLGPRGSRLVYLAEVRTLDDGRAELGLRELVGLQGERMPPLVLPPAQAAGLRPGRVAVLWPGRPVPLPLDPLLVYREGELAEEVLFLNRDRSSRQVEYLSYTTGRTERDRSTAPALAALLGRITGRAVNEEQLRELTRQSWDETPSVEALFGPAPAAGRLLGEYEILAELGRGGMGVVYLARQTSLGRLVALKTLPADLADDEVALARLRREVRALARCEHPNIVKVLSSGTLPDGQFYYTMEYVPGCDLELAWRELSGSPQEGGASGLSASSWAQAVLSACRKQREATTAVRAGGPRPAEEKPALPLPPLPELPSAPEGPGGYVRRVATLIRDAALALQAVHDQGLVHRDVKPANLMLTSDGTRVVLMDFGLAKGRSLATTVSRAGGLLGTLRYAAPEQLAAATLKVGPPADVRGLGVTLWELLTLRRLFASAEDEKQLAQMVHDQDVPRLRSVGPGLDRDLEAVVARATERRVADRIPTAGRLAEYLQLWLDGRPLPIRRPGTAELLWRWVRTHKTAAAAVLVVAATVVVALVLVTFAWDAATRAERLASNRADENDRLAKEQERLAGLEKQERENAERASAQALTEAEKARKATEFLAGIFEAHDPLGLASNSNIFPRGAGQKLDALKILELGRKKCDKELGDQPEVQAAVLAAIGGAYLNLSLPGEAKPLLERALALRQAHLKPTHPDVAASLHSLGNLRHLRGEYDAAEKLYREALALRRNAAPPGPLPTADTLFNLGWLLWEKGEDVEAEQFLSEALRLRRQALDDGHRLVAIARVGLAGFYLDQKQFIRAWPLIRQAAQAFERLEGDETLGRAVGLFQDGVVLLQGVDGVVPANPFFNPRQEGVRRLTECLGLIKKSSLGPRHMFAAFVAGTLGLEMTRLGDDARAEPYFRECLQAADEGVGLSHPMVERVVAPYAYLLQRQHKEQEADAVCQRVLKERTARFGPDHVQVANALVTYARVLDERRNGDPRRQAMYERARAIYQSAKPLKAKPVVQQYHVCLNQLGLIYLNEYHDPVAAEKCFRTDLDDLRRPAVFPPEDRAGRLTNLARALVERQQYPGAKALLDEARALFLGAPRDRQAGLGAALDGYALLYAKTRQPAQAAGVARELRERWPTGPDQVFLAGRHLLECSLLVGEGKPVLSPAEQGERTKYADEGVACCREAVRLYRQAGGARHTWYKFSLSWLARGLMQQHQDLAAAERLLQESLGLCRQDFGNAHEEVAFALGLLCQARLHQLRYDGVEQLQREALAVLGRLPAEKKRALGPRLEAERKAGLDRLADLYFATGQLAKAAAVARERRKTWPDDPEQAFVAGRCLLLCVPHVGQGRPVLSPAEQAERTKYADEGVACCREAVRLYRQAGGPRHAAYKFSLTWLAHGLRAKQDYSSAEKLLEESLPLNQKDFGTRHEQVAVVLTYLSATKVAQKKYTGVERDLQEALEICEAAPGGPRVSLSIALEAVGEFHRATGRPARAAEAARRRRRHWPDDPVQLFEAACELALCVSLVGQGKAELTPAERAERRDYTREALAALERSLASGLLRSDRLKQDPRLAAVRGEPAFHDLVRRAEKNGRDRLLRSATTLGLLSSPAGGPWPGATAVWLRNRRPLSSEGHPAP